MNTTCLKCGNPVISVRSYATGRPVVLHPERVQRGAWDVQGGMAVGARKQPAYTPHKCPDLFTTGTDAA